MSLKELTAGGVIRRGLLYVGLALAFLMVCGLLVAFSVRSGIELTGGWIGFGGFTGLLFWIYISRSKRYWRKRSFWLFTAALLTTHSLVFVVTLLNYPQWRMIWFAPVVVVEAGVFAALREALFSAQSR